MLSGIQKQVTGAPIGVAATAFWVAVCVGVAVALRMAIDPFLGATLWYPTFYPVVLLGTLFLGWRGGLAVLLLSAYAANFFFVPPRYEVTVHPRDVAGGLVFLTAGGLIMLTAALLRAALGRLEVAHARETLLNKELQHRMKNTLAIVQALVAQTARRSVSDPKEFQALLESRLFALASAHDLLSRGQWDICELPDLADRALAPFTGHGRFSIQGPPCTLRADACIPLVLGLHELATNAIKYGALSVDQGYVELTWRPAPEDAQEIVLRWAEHGGPAVVEPERQGLGRRLLRAQPGLDAVALHFRPQGVECEIRVRRAVASEDPPLATAKVEAALSASR